MGDLVGLRLDELSESEEQSDSDNKLIDLCEDKKRYLEGNNDDNQQSKLENHKKGNFNNIKYFYLNYNDIDNNMKKKYNDKKIIINPLNLFGGFMVPKTLQKSQQDARDCLISYINAANLLIDMLCLMNDNDNGHERREYIESKEKQNID